MDTSRHRVVVLFFGDGCALELQMIDSQGCMEIQNCDAIRLMSVFSFGGAWPPFSLSAKLSHFLVSEELRSSEGGAITRWSLLSKDKPADGRDAEHSEKESRQSGLTLESLGLQKVYPGIPNILRLVKA